MHQSKMPRYVRFKSQEPISFNFHGNNASLCAMEYQHSNAQAWVGNTHELPKIMVVVVWFHCKSVLAIREELSPLSFTHHSHLPEVKTLMTRLGNMTTVLVHVPYPHNTRSHLSSFLVLNEPLKALACRVIKKRQLRSRESAQLLFSW